MNYHGYGNLMAAMACQARIEAMKAENVNRELQGLSPAYGESEFFAEAKTLDELALDTKTRGWQQ